jgi:hypothetical protein
LGHCWIAREDVFDDRKHQRMDAIIAKKVTKEAMGDEDRSDDEDSPSFSSVLMFCH